MSAKAEDWRFCVAPMLDLTNSDCRALHRQFSRKARLYTEMVTTGALIYGDVARHLDYRALEQPLALQLGGGNPDELARACEIAQAYAYDEINLNVGCPSDRVQNNRIGACLMDDAHLVAKCLTAMQTASDCVVTVKHRLGIDEQDERKVLEFVDIVSNESPCRVFIVHARKAWLDGLSPKQNRDVPPLNYDLVYEIKQRYPQLTIVLNGGIESIADCRHHLQWLDGVMLGRGVYYHPALLLEVDALYGATTPTLNAVLDNIKTFIATELANGASLQQFTRHLLGLFAGQAGARQYRRILSEDARLPTAGIEVFERALQQI